MEFPKNYFDGEVRESFYVERMMKKVWAAQLEVLMEIDRICRKYGLTYFTEWGTLLGAVRHGGFIPWDDDLDICMKRKDYQKFIHVAKKELPQEYCVVNIHTTDGFTDMLTRVTNGDTIRIDEEHMKRYHGCPYVVGLDIFPMDFMAPNQEEDEIQVQMVQMVLGVAGMLEPTYVFGDDEETDTVIAQLEEFCGVTLIKDKPMKKQLYILGEQLCALYDEEEADEITLMPDHCGNIPHYRIPKECYSKAIMMPFENIMIPVPVGYETILPIKYGADWRVPRLMSANHNYPFYKQQQYMLYDALGYIPDYSV